LRGERVPPALADAKPDARYLAVENRVSDFIENCRRLFVAGVGVSYQNMVFFLAFGNRAPDNLSHSGFFGDAQCPLPSHVESIFIA
jgi:hypothetical protein